MNSDNPHPNVR